MPLSALFGRGRRRAAAQVEATLEAGIACFERGDVGGARERFAAALALSPDHPRALALAGVAQLAGGDAAGAETLLRRAIAGDAAPHLPWFNLGNALVAQGRPGDAAAAFDESARRAPQHFATWFNLARARLESGAIDAAIDAAAQCVALAPGDPAALVELATMRFRKAEATLQVADYDAAIDLFRRALALPDVPPAAVHNARLFLGDALSKRGRHTEALALFESLHAADPDDLDTCINLANCLNSLGRIRDAAPHYEKVTRLYPRHLPAISSAISAADYDHRISAEDNAVRRRAWMQGFADPARYRDWPNDRDPERRIRIGYVSPDFREHVAMTLFDGVLRHHDRAAFEITAYDATPFRDARNRSLRARVDRWREIDTLGTDAACALIRDDAIDLLVDLAGHTAGNRLMLFARKPAPVAATWLAYPGSTGLPEIDWIVTDPHTTPPDCESLVSESVWRLPHTRFCFSPPAASPAPRLPAPAALPTFGSFNNVSKLNPAVLSLWARVLDAVPAARLLVKYASLDDATARARLTADLAAAGIEPARVEMRGWSPYAEALDQYADVHVALDPFPYCGGLTSLDALWMGVPVVTLRQRQMAGRQTEAFLANVGHPDLVAADADAYVRIAADLIGDSARLAAHRTGLREAMRASPLLDHAGFTRALESAWRGMWRRWCSAA
ncbi:MAG: tetratricopeptide repeat protein [Burkholderiales bacterium]|nr:tetratricopeptide repeat protein [Burkholderiales bacterium]